MRNHSFVPSLATLALAIATCLGLAACQSSNSGTMDAGAQGGADVTASGTVEVLQQGLTNISTEAAAQNITAWQARLGASDNPAFASISEDLGTLKSELQSGSIDGAAAGELLVSLGDQTLEVADGSGDLQTLGETLRSAGQSLQ